MVLVRDKTSEIVMLCVVLRNLVNVNCRQVNIGFLILIKNKKAVMKGIHHGLVLFVKISLFN